MIDEEVDALKGTYEWALQIPSELQLFASVLYIENSFINHYQ